MSHEPDVPALGKDTAHESAHLHVTGRAPYVDDEIEPKDTLHAAIGLSERAHATLSAVSLDAVRAAPGVIAVLEASDIPGCNDCAPVVHDDPIFAQSTVEYVGQPVFAVVAVSADAARDAVRLARIDYRNRPAIVDIKAALRENAILSPSRTLSRGLAEPALDAADHRLQGSMTTGGQEHFYLECQVAFAMPREDGQMLIRSSTQNPAEVQRCVALALGIQAKDVTVECRRMGGGFGGKETQSSHTACVAALAAWKTGRAVKFSLTRRDDMRVSGKRHDFRIDHDVGFDKDGTIRAVHLTFASRCGRSVDLSPAVNDRAVCHADNAYYLPNVRIDSHRLRTNTVSNTAMRGFGGPQGMIAIENVLDNVARALRLDALDVRCRNFYTEGDRSVTPYGMTVDDDVIAPLVSSLEQRAAYRVRREAVTAFNCHAGHLRRGLALTPVKFGISFMQTHLNQAGALVNIYRDGTVIVNHGGTEMGQGLYTKVAQIVAAELQVPLESIRCSGADTSKVPNSSPTAASASSDLNGAAAASAARELRDRLRHFAAESYAVLPEAVSFRAGTVSVGTAVVPFAELVEKAYFARVPLSATGHYCTPDIGFDSETMTGRPFYYFAYGAAVSEVVVDSLTGESKLLRVDILQDVGQSLNPAIDRGQIEGAFLQGVGWLTSEELVWDDHGQLLTDSAATYRIPTASDWPAQFNVHLLPPGPNRPDTIFHSKGVGEPPLPLALSAFFAIKDAIGSFAPPGTPFRLDAPATPERILLTIEALRHTVGSSVGSAIPEL